MNEKTFEDLEQRLWTNPDQLTDEELELLVQECHQREEQTDAHYLTVLLCA